MWKIIEHHPDYRVSDEGVIQSKKYGSWTTLSSKKKGKYPGVALYAQGTRSDYQVHDLVLEAFVGRKPLGSEVCHWDGDVNNNSVSNLRYGDHVENALDRIRHQTVARPVGDLNTQAVLTWTLVREMRGDLASGLSLSKCSDKYKVSRAQVVNIKHGRSWIE